MSESIIKTENLTRSFTVKDPDSSGKYWFSKKKTRKVTAVRDLNFSIKAGEKVAFIGPNGAGKSTTLKILSGLLEPSAGSAQVCGLTPWEETHLLSHHIGLVFGQRSHLWPALAVKDSFDLLSKIYDLDDTAYQKQRNKLVELFGLGHLLSQQARTLSLGQRMRCDIAAALLHRPSVLFLDEPTIGLDVTAKSLLRDHLNKLAHEFETTVLLTSHDTDDIEKICQRVVLIDHGQKLLDLPLTDLQKQYTQYKYLRLATEEKEPNFDHPHVEVEEKSDHKLGLKVDTSKVAIEEVVSQCLSKFKLHDIGIDDLPLEDIIKEIYEQRACNL